MGHSPEFGQFVRDKRQKAGLSVRKLAQLIGVSHVYLGRVERAREGALDRKHWPILIEALGDQGVEITENDLERQLAMVRPLQLEISDHPPEYQDLALALARRIRDESIDDDDMAQLLKLLGQGREQVR